MVNLWLRRAVLATVLWFAAPTAANAGVFFGLGPTSYDEGEDEGGLGADLGLRWDGMTDWFYGYFEWELAMPYNGDSLVPTIDLGLGGAVWFDGPYLGAVGGGGFSFGPPAGLAYIGAIAGWQASPSFGLGVRARRFYATDSLSNFWWLTFELNVYFGG